mgnify:CR=1 FL=1
MFFISALYVFFIHCKYNFNVDFTFAFYDDMTTVCIKDISEKGFFVPAWGEEVIIEPEYIVCYNVIVFAGKLAIMKHFPPIKTGINSR